MDNKIKQKLFIFLPMLLIMSVILILFYSINVNKEKQINYEFTYYNEDNRYDIKFKEKKLKITKYEKCEDCDEEQFKEKEYYYSEENIKKLDEFILNNLNIKNNKEIYYNKLSDYEKKVLDGIILGEKFFEINVEKYKYKLDYRNKNIGYVFYFKDNKKILAKKLKINDDYNIVDIHTYEINFSEKNTDLIYEYIEKLSKEEESKSIYKYSIYKDEEAIINSLINNDELYILNSSNIKLLYEFSYSGLNCMTPILRLYDNYTYEYYYMYTINDQKELIPKVGSYNYNIKDIIDNIDKYEKNNQGIYIIEDNLNNEYITYSSNKELKEFLESINVKLSTCLEEQN